MKKLLIIFLAFICALDASAYFNHVTGTIYYVRKDGSDAHSGTTNSSGGAFLTIQKALSVVSGGDSIVVAQTGTYLETGQMVLIPNVSIHGIDSANCIIQTDLTTVYLEMLNCRSAEGTNGNQSLSGLKFDGTSSVFSLIRIGGRSNFSIHDCSFVDAQYYGVTFAAHNTDDNDPGYPSTYCTGNLFYDNKMYNCGNWFSGNGYGNLQLGGQKGMLIYNNTIIEDNSCYNNGWPIKYWQGGYNIGCKIYNNTLTSKLQCFTLGDLNWDFGIEMFNVAGLEIYNNTLINGAVDINGTTSTGYNTGVGSFWCAGYGYQSYIHDNTFYCTSTNTHVQTGITLEFTIDTTIIQNNTFDKFNIGVLFTPRTGDTIMNVSIQKNLFTNVSIGEGSEGYFVDCGVYSGSNINFNKLNIYNNTFLAASGAQIVNGIMLPNSTSGGTLKNFNIKNNILKNTSGAPIRVREGTVACDSLDIEYNSIFGCGNSNTPDYSVTPTHYTFANNLNVNPSFGTGYKLVTGSALVDAGTDVGLPYIGSAPDINWTDSTAPAPEVECGIWDSAYTGNYFNFDATKKIITCSNPISYTSALGTSNITGKVAYSYAIESMPSTNYNLTLGFATRDISLTSDQGGTIYAYIIQGDGTYRHNGFPGGGTSAFSVGDTLTFATDFTGATGTVYVYQNRTLDLTITGIDTSKDWYPCVSNAGTTGAVITWSTNLITDSSAYIPAGFTSLCTTYVPNVPPTVTATATPSTMTLPSNSSLLQATGSDPDGTIISYEWTVESGPGGSSFTSASSATTTVTGLTAGNYVFRCTVTDDEGATGHTDVPVTVNAAPGQTPYFRRMVRR